MTPPEAPEWLVEKVYEYLDNEDSAKELADELWNMILSRILDISTQPDSPSDIIDALEKEALI